MGNTLTGLIPVLYESLDVVSRELTGFIPAVYKNSNAERAALNESITYPITSPSSLIDVTPGVTAPDAGDQTIGNGSMIISKSKGYPVRWNGEEQKGMLNAGTYNALLMDQFQQAFRTLANAVELDIAVAAYKGASRAYGTAGTAPFGTAGDLSDVAQVKKILDDNGAPGDRRLVLGTTAGANMRGKQSVLFKVNEAGTADMLRAGILGQLSGFGIGESAQVQTITKGTGANYVTSGSTAVGVSDIALVTGNGTVNAGDVVTFAADAANKYVVGTGVAAPGTISLNKPGALVTIPTANALTVGANYTANIGFSKSAIHLVTRAPAMPVDANGKALDMADDVMIVTDPVTGLAFQIAMYRQFQQIMYLVSLAWGVKAVKSPHIVTLMG